MLKTNNMQSAIGSNRFILGIVALSVSFGLSLVLTWNLSLALIIGLITLTVTYTTLYIEQRQRNYEMLTKRDSLHRRIKEMEGLKSHLVTEINQLENHHSLLYKESNQLQNQIIERRNQRDSLNRELSSYIIEKKQLEVQVTHLHNEINDLEKTKVEINNSFSAINSEKRRLELNCSVSKAEINQLHNQLCELLQQKQELENNLTLLGRLKPQLEEKLYEMRVQFQELETEIRKQTEILIDKKIETENIEIKLNSLQTQLSEHQTQRQQLQDQISLLQDEREHLQSQVWELLQQIETLNPTDLTENEQEEDVDLFPFSDLLETVDDSNDLDDSTDNLSTEFASLIKQLPSYEIQVLKAIIENEHPHTILKRIAEENITMPNLLIDSINENANSTVGELIIDTSSEIPEIYPEYKNDLKRAIAIYENTIAE